MLIEPFLDYLRLEKNCSEKTIVSYGTDLTKFEEFFKSVDEEIDFTTVDADVIIDFSNAKAVDALLAYGVEKQIPIVLCTTGLSEQQLADVEKAYEKVAILKSANMSLGINTLMELLKKAAQVFAPAGFDMEIVEKHHNQKLDAPSGTALALADSMNEALDDWRTIGAVRLYTGEKAVDVSIVRRSRERET